MRNSVVRMSVVSVLLLVGSLTVPSSASAGLIGVWSFDGDATDSVGSNNGNVMGGATFVAGHAGFGQALSFDGTDDYVDLGFVGFPTYASSITIEAWFRTSAITEQYILQYGELDPPGPNGALVSLGTGKLGSSPVSQLITTPRGTLIQAGTNIADGQWHHGAMTFDQPTSRLRLYVDGTLEAGPSTAGLAAVIATNFAYVGWEGTQSNCCFWTGEIDELRIYNHALTASELGLTPSELGIPEPTTLLLLGTGLAIAGYRRRRQVRR